VSLYMQVAVLSIETEPTYQHDGHYNLWVRWTEDGSKYSLLIERDLPGIGVGYAAAKVQDMLRHAYAQGRVEAALRC